MIVAWGDASMDMDNASPRNMKVLREVGKITVTHCAGTLAKLADTRIALEAN